MHEIINIIMQLIIIFQKQSTLYFIISSNMCFLTFDTGLYISFESISIFFILGKHSSRH
jgi:hypothetical protein